MVGNKFYICRHCGNIIGLVHSSGVPMVCCGEKMEQLKPNTTDAAQEKHVPVITVEGDCATVKVGSAAHPMLSEHFIGWIYLETEKGGQRKEIKPGEAPVASFKLVDDKALGAFAYCNLHGLWYAPCE
ncbi:MAG: desulfoferrodoxin [Oscillospiraceae bacterium]|jgi:superoxide reductase|nr:desulfoferrodoxin [Oscillospiraceae bacterium]